MSSPFADPENEGDWRDRIAERELLAKSGGPIKPTERLCPDCFCWHSGEEC